MVVDGQRSSGVGIAAALAGLPVTEETRARTVARLRYLWGWEAFNMLFVPACALFALAVTDSTIGWPVLSGCLLLSGELAAGAAYWKIKLGQVLRAGVTEPLPGARAFRTIRRLGPIGLILGALAILLPAVTDSAAALEIVVGAVLWVLAVGEHVNYFHWQLAHDTTSDVRRLRATRRLRRSFLAHDIDKSTLR